MTDWTVTVEAGTTLGQFPSGWEDLTGRLIDDPIQIVFGRSDEQSLDEAGTATLRLDNHDGRWDAGIAPNTAIRVRATVGSHTVPLFYGLVESAPVRWIANGNDSVVDVALSDPRAVLARTETAVELPRQLSGARIAALLSVAGWPSAPLRDLDAGQVLVDPLEADEPINVLTAIRDAVEAEDGTMWIAGDGAFTFRDRHARLSAPTVATFGPAADYGLRWAVVRDLPVAGVEAEASAGWIVARYARPHRRFATLTVEAALSGAALDAVLELEPGSLVRVKHYPPNGPTVDELVHVERVSWSITAGLWRGSYTLSPYHGAGPWFTLDDNELGLLDSTSKLAP